MTTREIVHEDRDLAQLGLAGFLVLVGVVTLWDTTRLEVGFADPVGPQAFPYVVGTGSLLLGLALGVAALAGSRGEVEGGEDVDLDQSTDWQTVGRLVGVLVLTVLTVSWLGWALTGAGLFAGAAWSLGSRTLVRDVLVGLALAVGSWYAFVVGLGVPLAPGVLDGIL
ncbi:tripartite tricarboxylate transporter TctB family protein [Nocardioides ginkgobilobae]